MGKLSRPFLRLTLPNTTDDLLAKIQSKDPGLFHTLNDPGNAWNAWNAWDSEDGFIFPVPVTCVHTRNNLPRIRQGPVSDQSVSS